MPSLSNHVDVIFFSFKYEPTGTNYINNYFQTEYEIKQIKYNITYIIYKLNRYRVHVE